MKLLIVRSIPLSTESQEAWHSIEAKFLDRKRGGVVPNSIAAQYDAILNLGNWETGFKYEGTLPVFNTPTSNRSICYPSALRKTLPDFLPTNSIKGPHWHKQSGHKGSGKVFHDAIMGECAIFGGDVQAHIEGTEYRVVTVGNQVVQATKKTGAAPNFDFEWVGVQGIANNGIIPFLKEATTQVPNYEYTVIGWDIIHNGNKPFIIEGNTSPGVNIATAGRIGKAMKEILNAGT